MKAYVEVFKDGPRLGLKATTSVEVSESI
uniref:Uncharacterized protein n=1 Tax=Rhizophora mucronata TaxID=61149 RepID=A0A2P2QFI3_RHIMU